MFTGLLDKTMSACALVYLFCLLPIDRNEKSRFTMDNIWRMLVAR
jgi:hypothetical protein